MYICVCECDEVDRVSGFIWKRNIIGFDGRKRGNDSIGGESLRFSQEMRTDVSSEMPAVGRTCECLEHATSRLIYHFICLFSSRDGLL